VWDRAENIDTLARIAGHLPWPVKVAGSAAPQGHAGHGDGGAPTTHDGVEVLGWLPGPELGALMDRAAIFAHPARYEPFGLSALEAALRGCALVLGDLPSLRELWADAAIYVRPDDEAGLREAIVKLADDPDLRAEIAARANLRARLFTPARNARAMRDVYETIILARRAPVLTGLSGRETRSA